MGDVGERELGRLAEGFRDELLGLSQVSDVDISGARNEEVTIEVSEEALQRYQLSFAELSAAIRASSINLSSGDVKTPTGRVQLRAENWLTIRPILRTLLSESYRLGHNSSSAMWQRLSMVLRISTSRVYRRYPSGDVADRAVRPPIHYENIKAGKRLDRVKAPELPQGVEIMSLADMADAYDSRMSLIFDAAWMGLLLVMAILLLTLRFTVALWVTVGIAISFRRCLYLPTRGRCID